MKDDRAVFFDINRHPDKHKTLSLDLREFLDLSVQGQLFGSEPSVTTTRPVLPDIDGALTLGTNEWIKLQLVLIWALTGKIADRDTVAPYKDVYRNLLKQFNIQNSFRISVAFAYLTCAVRLKRNGWGAEDKNNVDDFESFCRQLLDPAKGTIMATTFMCAHREADEEDSNKLVKKLKTESFVRIINALKGAVYNLDDKKVDLAIYHLDGSRYSLLAIFPNIIFQYLESEGLGMLLNTLGKHYHEIEQLGRELTTDKFSIHLSPSEKHIIETRAFCEEIGGEAWRSLTPHEAARILPEYLDEITGVAAMAEVSRYMPEYNAVKINGINVNYKQHAEDEEVMRWYSQQEDLSPYGKAFYETLFYFNWGRKTRQTDGVAIGIDRDHSDFQVRAFHAGYNGEYKFGSRAPVVYLRRSDREVGKNDINSLSLRQFWRYSADHKR